MPIDKKKAIEALVKLGFSRTRATKFVTEYNKTFKTETSKTK